MKHKRLIAIPALLAVAAFSFALPTHVADAQVAGKVANVVTGLLTNGVGALMGVVLYPAAVAILGLMSLLTYLSGILLNQTAYYTIVAMATSYAKIGTIDSTWATLRDLANMGFIFVLLYAAIQQVLGIGKGIQRLIVNMVVAALLVNFSLFFTKLIIDASNILALMFYNAMAPGAATGAFWQTGLSNIFVNVLGIQDLFHASTILRPASIFTIGALGSVALAIVSFVFFAISMMLIARYVALILLMILSPIAFVANVIPNVGDLTKNFWGSLIGQAFFAPAFMMLAWISASVAGGLKKAILTSSVGWTDALSGTIDANGNAHSGAIDLILLYAIVIIFLISALVTARQWSNRAGGSIKQLTGFITGGAAGITGKFGRGTLGRAGQWVADNEKLKAAAPESRMARLALLAGNKTAGASFDVRGFGGLGKDLGAGKAQKGGFAKDLKNKTDQAKKDADTMFKPSDLAIAAAEGKLDAAKKTGDAAAIAEAQRAVDELKGLSVEDARKRKINEIRRDQGVNEGKAKEILKGLENDRFQEVERLKAAGMSEKDAKEQAKARSIGWEAEPVESVTNKRKKTYAEGVEKQELSVPQNIPRTNIRIPLVGGKDFRYDFTGRLFFGFGPVKKERLAEALAIRKSTKDKKSAEKIAEEIEKQAKESADEGSGSTGGAVGGETAAPSGETPPTT